MTLAATMKTFQKAMTTVTEMHGSDDDFEGDADAQDDSG